MTSSNVRFSSLRVRIGGVVSLLLAVFTISALAAVSSSSSLRRRDPPPPVPMTNAELENALRANQIKPETLAALGFSAQDVAALVGRARQHLGPVIQDLRDARDGRASARVVVDTQTRTVRSGLGGEQGPSTLNNAQSTFTTADSTLATRNSALTAAAVANALSETQTQMLAAVVANKAWRLPIEYRCRSGATEAQWLALRSALADQRIAAREGGSPSQANQQILDAWAENPTVSAARTNLEALPTITTAWNSAIYGPP